MRILYPSPLLSERLREGITNPLDILSVYQLVVWYHVPESGPRLPLAMVKMIRKMVYYLGLRVDAV